MILCYRLWLGERNFPLCPSFTWMHAPAFVHLIIFAASCILLVCIIVVQSPAKFITGFVVLGALMALFDENRWQPWFYQYLVMFFVLGSKCEQNIEKERVLNLLRFTIAAIYFWSGLNKLNPNFPGDMFPWLMEPITNHLTAGSISKLQWLAYLFPIAETATGIALLIPQLRKPALASVIFMHVFILFSLGPLGHNYNPVVWPWNIAMVCFCLILFKGEKINMGQFKNMLRPFRHKLVFGVFALAPLLCFFNAWPSYLSHNLYSGNTSNGVIYISDSVEAILPEAIKPYSIGEMNQNQITIKYWCMQELGVPAFPEKRNFQSVAGTFYQYASDSSEIYFMFTPKMSIRDL
ncbi:MAG: MauE/DoxX family redox-associated membrane protein [Bacteroidia bacterium]